MESTKKENVSGYFTRRIMCRQNVKRDVKVVAEIGRMLYNHNKEKFNLNDNGQAESIVRDLAYSLTVSLASRSNDFFSRVLFKKQSVDPYSLPVGFAMGTFDDTFKFAILNSLYIDKEHSGQQLEDILIDSFLYWSKIMNASRVYMEKESEEEGVVSKLIELKGD